eukprot:155535-Pelagomonas_calceolata.AAC.4
MCQAVCTRSLLLTGLQFLPTDGAWNANACRLWQCKPAAAAQFICAEGSGITSQLIMRWREWNLASAHMHRREWNALLYSLALLTGGGSGVLCFGRGSGMKYVKARAWLPKTA